jgi:hypothetical protein
MHIAVLHARRHRDPRASCLCPGHLTHMLHLALCKTTIQSAISTGARPWSLEYGTLNQHILRRTTPSGLAKLAGVQRRTRTRYGLTTNYRLHLMRRSISSPATIGPVRPPTPA